MEKLEVGKSIIEEAQEASLSSGETSLVWIVFNRISTQIQVMLYYTGECMDKEKEEDQEQNG